MSELYFHKWLKDSREKSGLTQQQLADRAGVTKGYVSLLERNQPHTISGALPKPDVDKVDALAKALNVSVDEARLAAGYAPTNQTDPIPEELKLLFYGAENWSVRKWEAITEAIKNDIDLINKVMPD